jgi:hypothetical protein
MPSRTYSIIPSWLWRFVSRRLCRVALCHRIWRDGVFGEAGHNETAIHLDALEPYRKTQIHFVDCLIAATPSAENTPVSTFDQDFRNSADERIETQ